MRLVIAALAALLACAKANPNCQTLPNYNTNAYTYTVCTGTKVVELNTSKEYCQEHGYGWVVTFPNENEYTFLVNSLNASQDSSTFKYIPGFYQQKNSDNVYVPETGIFHWVTDPNTKITEDSTTYWEPFRRLIKGFEKEPYSTKQSASYLLDLQGRLYAGVSLNGGESTTAVNGNVVCMKEGVEFIATTAKQNSDKPATEFDYWILIVVAAGVLVLGVILATIAYCVFKSMRRKQELKFQKVPQNDNQSMPPHKQV